MLAHLKAIRDRLVALNPAYRGYIVSADSNTAPPYFIVSAPGWDAGEDVSIDSDSRGLDTDVRVMAVAGTTDGVFIMLDAARAALSPLLAPKPLAVTGRKAETQWTRSEFVDIDDSITLTTGKHPAFGVDTYHLSSEPA